MVTESLCQCDIDPKGEDACAKDPLLLGKSLTFAIISALLDEASPENMGQHGVLSPPCHSSTVAATCKMHTFSCSTLYLLI